MCLFIGFNLVEKHCVKVTNDCNFVNDSLDKYGIHFWKLQAPFACKIAYLSAKDTCKQNTGTPPIMLFFRLGEIYCVMGKTILKEDQFGTKWTK